MLSKHSIAANDKLIRTCSIWRALDVIGDGPTLLILQSIWMQQRRFSRIAEHTLLPKAVLSNRLSRLKENDILGNPISEKASTAASYQLTHKGLDLFWTVLMLLRWESVWTETKKAFEISLRHKTCGHHTSPLPSCGNCQQTFSAKDTLWQEGPGIGLMKPIYTRRRASNHRLIDRDFLFLFTQSAQILGDRWSSLIIRSILTGLYHYDQILEDTAMATNILSERLKWLIEIDIIEHVKPENGYKLTEKGSDFLPVLVMLQSWGDKYCASPEGPPVVLLHKGCGQVLIPIVTCDKCDMPVKLADTILSISGDF